MPIRRSTAATCCKTAGRVRRPHLLLWVVLSLDPVRDRRLDGPALGWPRAHVPDHHVTWSVNSVCHTFGKRTFETATAAATSGWSACSAFGEGWHNNHHAFPRSAFHGLRWWQFDLSGYLISGAGAAAAGARGLAHPANPPDTPGREASTRSGSARDCASACRAVRKMKRWWSASAKPSQKAYIIPLVVRLLAQALTSPRPRRGEGSQKPESQHARRVFRFWFPSPRRGEGLGGGGGGQGTAQAPSRPCLLRSASLPQRTLGEGLIVLMVLMVRGAARRRRLCLWSPSPFRRRG